MPGRPRRQLSLFDSTCLIVGIIIGAGIFETAPQVAAAAPAVWVLFGFWIAGGLLSLAGALGYAELATAYPRAGGDYVYLGRAYGRWAGFLFGWIQLVIVRPGDIAAMAFVFARYGSVLVGSAGRATHLALAVGAVAVLTAINTVGVREAKWAQNALTVVKALGLVLILAVALFAPAPEPGAGDEADALGSIPPGLALIFVLFTFGGWNEMAYVAAEVRQPERNIVRALALGTVAVTVLYLLVNGAYLLALGHPGVAASGAVATETVGRVLPDAAERIISALICISALGALNGLVFAGARITFAMGEEHPLFRPLGRWHGRTGTPVPALLAQAAIAVVLILVLGSFLKTVLYTAAAVYVFYLATTLAVVVLRHREPERPRPYRMLGYPVTPLVFVAACAFMIYSALSYDPQAAGACAGILLAGLPVYWISRAIGNRRQRT
ncbi:MAG: amino acid permease [Planctomycetes bacterium]|nr:amino acid permease [Planctomycetota bacterium]